VGQNTGDPELRECSAEFQVFDDVTVCDILFGDHVHGNAMWELPIDMADRARAEQAVEIQFLKRTTELLLALGLQSYSPVH
jgi:hypothetical protein